MFVYIVSVQIKPVESWEWALNACNTQNRFRQSNGMPVGVDSHCELEMPTDVVVEQPKLFKELGDLNKSI